MAQAAESPLSRTRWRWGNVPLPETYLMAIAAAVVLHRRRPLRLRIDQTIATRLGWPVVLAGLGLIAWAVRSAAQIDIDRSSQLLTSGAYGVIRHPMYCGWTLVIAGSALGTRSAWLACSAVPAAVLLRREILREEAALEDAFGPQYRAYADQVNRFVPRSLTSEPGRAPDAGTPEASG